VSEPAWLDRQAYPFTSRWLDGPEGRLHYIDEGQGSPLVMVHGIPTWSFLYRHLIRGLAPRYRCVAADNLGFGLSDKPPGGSYRPADHAANLAALIEHLGLRDLTLVVHDFGGPIGLAYALDHPQNVRRLVLFNTWMWSLRDDREKAWIGRLIASPLGRFLYTRLNVSARVIFRHGFADRAKLDRVHRQYLGPMATPADRYPTWVMGRELLGSSDWYESLWARRDRIRDLPALLVWGMRDVAFREKELTRWTALFTRARVVRLAEVGHAPQEEAPDIVVGEIERFLA
jgi:pimeloyl-ACP methyl ester carboxylesterase